MNAAHSIPQAFYRASYRFLSPGPEEHRCGTPKRGQQFRVEVKNEVFIWENDHQEEEGRLYILHSTMAYGQTNSGRCVAINKQRGL